MLTKCDLKHFNANELMTRNVIILNVNKFVDRDGLIAEDYLTKRVFEIRLYGIDAPEMNYCNKIKKDEKENLYCDLN